MNCNPLHNDWIHTNVLTEDAKAAAIAVYTYQWGGGSRDK